MGKLLRRGRRPLSAMAKRVSIWGSLMLYRPVSTSHGGKTSGGRAEAATAEAMINGWGRREKRQVGGGGCVGVDDAQRVRDRDDAEQFFKGRSERGDRWGLCESFYRRADVFEEDIAWSVTFLRAITKQSSARRFLCLPRVRG